MLDLLVFLDEFSTFDHEIHSQIVLERNHHTRSLTQNSHFGLGT